MRGFPAASAPRPLMLRPLNHAAAIFRWEDPEPTGAVGWVVLDRIINQVSGGGIFMHPEATLEEVADVARNMSLKFTLTRPQIGGAKAGIRFDPNSRESPHVLRRFLHAHKALLANVWVTAGDLNTSDAFIESVIRDELGLGTCQWALAQRIARMPGGRDRTAQLAPLIQHRATEFFPMIEAAVGRGVAEAIAFARRRMGRKPRVLIQGFGAVGSTLAWYLEELDIATVVGVADLFGYFHDPEGLPIRRLLKYRQMRVEEMAASGAGQEELRAASKNIYPVLDEADQRTLNAVPRGERDVHEFLREFVTCEEAEVFSPCAGRYQITKDTVLAMGEGLWKDVEHRFLVAGANNPFGEFDESGELVEDVKGRCASLTHGLGAVIVPDWVANSGTAQFFHQALFRDFDLEHPEVVDQVLEAVAEPIRIFLDEAQARAERENRELLHACYKLALERLDEPERLPLNSSRA